MPSLSVVQTVPSRRRNDAPALSSPPKPKEPSSRPSTNHLKPDRHLDEACGRGARRRGRSSQLRDERLADGGVLPPAGAVGEEVGDRDREIVVRVQEARAAA